MFVKIIIRTKASNGSNNIGTNDELVDNDGL